MFNLSVLVTDAFMRAVRDDGVLGPAPIDGRIWRSLQARDLWNRTMRATYDYAEPGVIFCYRPHQQDEQPGPCGKPSPPPIPAWRSQPCRPMAPACWAASTRRLVDGAVYPGAHLTAGAGRSARVAVRMMDNVVDALAIPLAPAGA